MKHSAGAERLEIWQQAGFGLYVHWPFCESKCPYCDFNSHVAASVDHGAWRQAMLAEVRRVAAETPGRRLDTIYFGGGTPSLMAPETVEAIIRAASDAWSLSNDLEITLEANPGSVETAKMRGFRSAGVNRVSIGVQALNDPDLRRLGRMHSVDQARLAIETAGSLFDRVSFDLIYARQGQSLSAWEAELTEALKMARGHLSLYQLTIEPGTVFGKRHELGQLRDLPDEDTGVDMYELTQRLCEAAGYPAYEVSNHAVPGQESRHNLIYWRGGDYAGIGPGAHGRITTGRKRIATAARLEPSGWLAQVVKSGTGDHERQVLSTADVAEEYLMMALRTQEGADLERLGGMADRPGFLAELADMATDGLLQRLDGQLATTGRGRLLLNQVIRRLVLALEG